MEPADVTSAKPARKTRKTASDEATAAASTDPVSAPSAPSAPHATPDLPEPAALGRAHAQRLREVYRSAGWPCQDAMELELLAAGLLERVREGGGHETLRLTESGIAFVAHHRERHRAALGPHEMLVERVALEMARAGRIAWRGLRLRAQVPQESGELQWALRTWSDTAAKIIFVSGSPFDAMKPWQRRFYFDQGGTLTSKFGIRHTPAVVSAAGASLKISEVPLPGETAASGGGKNS